MTDMQQSRQWFPFGDGADAHALLFCLPFAGGGASNFAPWRKLCPDVGVVPLQYPGHETRIDEAPAHSAPALLAQMADALAPRLTRPYVLFGYSMGARLAFALIGQLAARGLPPPAALMVAAHRPPDRASEAVKSIGLPDAQFKDVLRAYGGVPDELLEDDDFCAMLLPLMRADFALAAQPVDQAPVACPVIAYAGRDDAAATPADMAQWARFTSADFRLREFAGGHFFFRDAPGFGAALQADLTALLAPQRDRFSFAEQRCA